MFFGFASCPDICPITMAELKKFYEQSDSPAVKNNLKIAMISVDPMRDTPEVIGTYVDRFNEDFVGVTGDFQEIASVASQFFIAYSEPVYQHGGDNPADATTASEQSSSHTDHSAHSGSSISSQVPPSIRQLTPNADSNYLIEHSGHIAVISPDGKFHSVLRPPHRANDLARAFSEIVNSSRF